MAFPYNISEVSGAADDGPDAWSYTVDITDPSVTVVTGDFDQVDLLTGTSGGEAANGYTFTDLSPELVNEDFGRLEFNEADGTFVFFIDKQALFASGSDQVVSFTITGFDGADSDADTVTITLLICVVSGTVIDTEEGQRAVETLVAGDKVRTLDAGFQKLEWVGQRKVGAEELAAHPDLKPILIRKDALGPGRPFCDLRVSPQHRVLLRDWRAQMLFGEDEVLAPAKALVNDGSIRVDHDADEVTYHHLLFSTHQIILTDGAETESFFPGRFTMDALADATRTELLELFPDLHPENAGYGAAARRMLRVGEARLLA
ncbi:MAG: Hint domain-containing protein [Pseudomonadota bacterium]